MNSLPTRSTSLGEYVGRVVDDVEAYLGIPYALPPKGRSRFRAPAPIPPHPDRFDAGHFGPSCPQLEHKADHRALTMFGMPLREEHTDEDCLYLNVWCPRSVVGAPVLVWVHAGVNKGSASSGWYEGARLAAEGMVVVTVNHRLGRLGHLYLGGIDEHFRDSGNAGLLDLIEALRWVQQNIAGFGGDPGLVTLGGTCGGAAKVLALLTSPAASGLFHRAMLQSREGGLGESAEKLGAQADLVRSLFDAPAGEERLADAAAALPVDGVLHREPSVKAPFVVDGITLHDRVDRAWLGGSGSRVPLLIGYTSDDAFMMARAGLPWRSMDRDDLARLLEPQLGDHAAGVVSHYSAALPDETARSLYSRILTDCRFVIPALIIAEAAVGAGVPTHVYEFEWGVPLLDSRLRTPHGIDAPFFFGNVDAVPVLRSDPSARARSDELRRVLHRFVTAGEPGRVDDTPWPLFGAEGGATMSIGHTVAAGPSSRLAAWDDLWRDLPVMDLLSERPLYVLGPEGAPSGAFGDMMRGRS